MNFVATNISCGIREVYGIDSRHTPKVFIEQFLKDARAAVNAQTNLMYPEYWRKFRFATFSHNQDYFKVCDAICDFIQHNDLGEITKSNVAKNPNSTNHIRIYIWEINWENLLAWEKTKDAPTPPANQRLWAKLTSAS